MNWTGEIAKLLKESPKFAVAVALAAGFILLFPESVLVRDFPDTLKPYISGAFILAVAMITAFIAFAVVNKCRHWMTENGRVKVLHALTPPERDLLRGYLEGETKSRRIDPSGEAVTLLIKRDILTPGKHSYMSVRFGEDANRTEFSPILIHDWAYNYLQKHPKLIA